jgi:ketosteroid isomerase-like protein
MTDTPSSNVALVEKVFALFEAERLDDAFELADPEIELCYVVVEHTFKGVKRVRREIDSWLGRGRKWRTAGLHCADVSGKVLVTGRIESESSFGTPIELPLSWLFTISDGRVTRIDAYANRRHAMESLKG